MPRGNLSLRRRRPRISAPDSFREHGASTKPWSGSRERRPWRLPADFSTVRKLFRTVPDAPRASGIKLSVTKRLPATWPNGLLYSLNASPRRSRRWRQLCRGRATRGQWTATFRRMKPAPPSFRPSTCNVASAATARIGRKTTATNPIPAAHAGSASRQAPRTPVGHRQTTCWTCRKAEGRRRSGRAMSRRGTVRRGGFARSRRNASVKDCLYSSHGMQRNRISVNGLF